MSFCKSCKRETTFSSDGFCDVCGRNESASIQYLQRRDDVEKENRKGLAKAINAFEKAFTVTCGLLLALVPVFVIWIFTESVPFSGETKVYRMFCPKSLNNGQCTSAGVPMGSVTFKVLADHQTVVYWYDEQSPHRLKECSVRNPENWSCQFPSEQSGGQVARWEMVDGNYRDAGSPSGEPSAVFVYQVPKWRWWAAKVRPTMK